MIVLVLERDLGSSLLFFAVFVTMVWIATERASYLLIGLLLFSGGAYVSYQRFTHVQTRVEAWVDPWQDPKNKGFQIIEGTFAMAEGGLTGTGFGLGRPYKVPRVETDFIFAAIGEELGLAGSTAILIAFLLIVASGLRIAVRAAPSVREDVGGRSDRAHRLPGVHHHRRHHARRAPDRHHVAVRLVWRFIAARELCVVGAVGAHLRRVVAGAGARGRSGVAACVKTKPVAIGEVAG